MGRMMNKLFTLCLLVFGINVNAQVINYVDKEFNADFNVYFTKYKHEADVIVIRTNHKHEAKTIPGYWFWRDDDGEEYDNDRVNIFQVKHKYQSDYVVYIGKYSHEVQVNWDYIEEWIK